MARKDAPFFVEKPDNLWRRQNFDLINGSGEEPKDRDAGQKAAHNQYKETIIMLFLRESGLGPEDFEKSSADAGLLEEQFTNFIKSETEEVSSEAQKLLESMTFAGVAQMCEIYARDSREAVRLMPLDASEEARVGAFFAVRYFTRINDIMQKAVSATASQKAASRNIVIVHPDESPAEAS